MNKILLVHQAEHVLRMEQTLLKRRDHETLKASTGAEALVLAREKLPQLVILDETLPDMDPLEVCRKLREDRRTADVSILVSMERPDEGRRIEFLEAGANDFFVRPVSHEQLNRKVGELLHLTPRRFLRTLVKLEVEAQQDSKQPFFGTSVNISEGGILLEAPHELSMGETLRLRLFLPEDSEPLELKARVVRQAAEMSTRGPSYGLCFTGMRSEDRERLRGFVVVAA